MELLLGLRDTHISSECGAYCLVGGYHVGHEMWMRSSTWQGSGWEKAGSRNGTGLWGPGMLNCVRCSEEHGRFISRNEQRCEYMCLPYGNRVLITEILFQCNISSIALLVYIVYLDVVVSEVCSKSTRTQMTDVLHSLHLEAQALLLLGADVTWMHTSVSLWLPWRTDSYRSIDEQMYALLEGFIVTVSMLYQISALLLLSCALPLSLWLLTLSICNSSSESCPQAVGAPFPL